MPGKLGLPEILLILAVALLIFGPSKLADLGKQKPDDVEIPWMVAKADLRLAYNKASGNDPDAAKTYRAQAIKVFEDAMKAQPTTRPATCSG